jgi:hypothetical protein
MVKRGLAVVLSLVFVSPSLAQAQQPRAGVVTTLEGNVSARRVALPGPVPLRFKDDVFLQDTVTTGDRSLARMLLGGKAVVTVRERSVLTITEVPGKSTIDLESGKFALAVAREKMRPGEEIQIRTPNAVAGVRGTVVVTEVSRQGAQLSGAPAVVTNFFVLRGTISAQRLDPNTKQPVGTPLHVGTLQAYTGAGTAAPQVKPVPPEQVGQITSGLQPSGPKGGGEAGQEQVKAQAVQTAVALVGALIGGPDTQVALMTAPPVAPPQGPAQSTPPAPIVAVSSQIETAQTLAAETTASESLDDLLSILAALNITLTDKPAKSFTGSFTSDSGSPLLQLNNAIVLQTGDADFIEVASGADVSLAGPLATFTNSTLSTAGSLLGLSGNLTSTSTSALFSLDPSTIVTGEALIDLDGGALTLAGPLLVDVAGTILAGQEFVAMRNGARITGTGTGALVQLDGTAVDGTAALSMTGSSMELAGPLVSISNSPTGGGVQGGGQALFKLDASSITSTTSSPLISFTASEGTPDGNFIRLVNGSTVSLAGPLFSGTDSDFGSGQPNSLASFVTVLDGSTITSTGTSPLIFVSGSSIDTHGAVVTVRRSSSAAAPSKITVAGPLFSATNSSINTTSSGFGDTFGTANSCCSTFGVEQGAVLTGTGTGALIDLTNSTVTVSDADSGANFFFVSDTVNGFPGSELVAASTVSLAGPLLSATGSTITPLFSLIHVNRSSLSSSTTSALVSLASSTVAAGGTDISGSATPFARFLTVVSANSPFGSAGTAASVSLAGPFVSATSSTLSATQFIGLLGGASFASTTTGPLVSLDNTSLKLVTVTQGSTTERGHVVNVGGQGGANGHTFATMDLKGPLLGVGNGSALDLSGSLVNVFAGGQIVESHPTSPFVSLNGGTHKIASDSTVPLFGLLGRTNVTTSESIDTSGLSTSTSTLTLGTDEPLKRSGSGAFLDVAGATVSADRVLNLDDALLAATAPLLALRGGATLTSAADALNLTGKAKLTSVGPLVKLDASTLTISSGHAVRAMGGSFLSVSGDLFSLVNGSKLNITNGGAIFVSGDSVVKISGALINFGGTSGNQLNISNSFSPNGACSTECGGLAVATQNGASLGNVSITSPIKNSGLGSVNVTGSAVVLDGANSKIIISGN